MGVNIDGTSVLGPLPKPSEKAARFPVIGLGASAGGLQALKDFFTGMPADSGMAFVVIMHLSPKHESHAAGLLQATTGMPVTQVTEAVRVEPNHVYVIPPTKNLEMSDGHINLTEPEPLLKGRQMAIDLFFRTLGDTHKERAVGIVLSGMGSDGTNGLKRIKEQNGLTFAQDPKEAEHDSMPRHAMNSGLVDFVLPVADIRGKLLEIWRNASLIKLPPEIEPPNVASQEDADEAALLDIFLLLRSHTGHDFTHYKRATVLRRIERRLQVNGLHDLTAYLDFMREYPMEAQALLKDLLISVTNFFRDRAAFNELEREVVPALFHEKTAGDQVRVWVVGCATGEEAYSVAMLLLEYAARLASPPSIQIFATDIAEVAIHTAREGSYTKTIEADISAERLRRFFVKEPGGYRVKKEVRERVLFAVHNLIKDPPFSRLNAITCRNLLIYLNREAQEHIFELFHFVLLQNGFLFLGNSESAEGATNLFATVDKKQRIYRAQSIGQPKSRVPSLPFTIPSPPVSAPQTTTNERQQMSFGELHQRLLKQYAPPSVIVNAAYDIEHLTDSAGRFLHFSDGEPSRNLLKVVHQELRIDLRSALFRAAQTGKSFATGRVRIKRDTNDVYVSMIARPVRADATSGVAHDYFLVLFDEVEGLPGAEGGAQHAGGAEPVMHLLEEELQSSKEQHQATIEQYETQTEEIKASNEELQAMNEELRSATEELETGKEELQSVNEEIQTINAELMQKIDELAVANSDFQNLISSTDLATVFVDCDLNIKFYTPRAQDIFRLLPSDTGRPLSDITHKLDYADLLTDVERVLTHGEKTDREVASRDGRWFIAQVTPYRAAANIVEGAVLTFVDFTSRKLAETSLREAKERLRLLVESARDHAIYTIDAAGRIDYWNSGAQALFGYTETEVIGQSAALLLTPADRDRKGLECQMAVACELGSAGDERWYMRKDGTRFYASGVLTRLRNWRDASDSSVGYAMIARDLTQRKTAEETIEESVRFQAHLLDTVEQSVIATNLDGVVIYWNQFAQTLYGWTSEEAVGRNIMELTTPEAMAEQAIEIMSHLRQGERWSGELNVKRRDGTTFTAQIINSPINDDEGTLIGIAGVSLDITERKHAEILLDTQKQVLEMVVGGIPLAEVLKYLASIVERQSSGSSIASILILDQEGRLHTGAAPSLPEDHVQAIEGIEADKNVGTCSAAAATGKTIITPDIAADPKWKELKHRPLGLGLQAAWSLPIVAADERVLGAFGTYFREKREPTKLERQTVEILAKTAALAIERKQAEEALRDAHERITNIFESITDCFYALDANWRFTYVNPQAEAYFNRPKETMLGRAYTDVFPLTRGSEALARLHEALSEQKPVQFEIISPTTGKWVDLHVFPAEWGLSVYFRDITERKQADEELNASEERLRTIFEASRDGILVEDDERIVYANQSYTQLFGYEDPEELIGQHVSTVISAEDTERLLEFGKSRRRGSSPASVYEFRGKRKDGTLVELEASVSASKVRGHSYITTIVRDITERKRAQELLRVSEERFRATFEQANVGIVQLTFDGQLLIVNPGFCKIVGYTETECQDLTVKDVTHPDDYELEETETRRLLSGEISGYSIEKRYLHKNGSIVWVQMTASLVRRASGEPSYRLAIVEDITERKRAEEELRSVNEQLEGRVMERTAAISDMNAALQVEISERRRIEAERLELLRRIVIAQEDERARIAREMHDQFGQQLTALNLKLDALKETWSDNKNLCDQVEALQLIARQLDEDVDHMVWEVRPTALDDLGLQAALSSYVANWSKHFGVPVQIHASGLDDDRLTPEVETALYRIAQEALNNIAKHAQPAQVAVVLERRGDQVSLIVEDDGVGFDLQRVMGASEGLGLIGMRERATLVGGTIEMESQPNDGATVVVRIPVAALIRNRE